MQVSPKSCANCGSEVDGSRSAYGSLCLACVLRSGYTPGSDPSGPATTWAEVFPQLEVERTLREEDGLSVYLAQTHESDTSGRAILQVVSGSQLASAGGAAALEDRVRRLAAVAREIDGIPRVLDSGDLGDAYFLVTETPPLPSLPQAVAGKEPDELSLLLQAVAEGLEGIQQAARAESVSLRFDPELCFVDEDTGVVVQTPGLLPTATGTAGENKADMPMAITLLEEGNKIGSFQLEKRVGEGGFGEVWRARQEHPVVRIVALKIMKRGLHSPRARARFEIEQQSLARLDHPHIASFFDGGVAPDGRPYFVMEWIEGMSLNDHCDQVEAPLEERLRLFREVCEAVHHAHQKGIIHRDLKPSNVMVSATGEGRKATVKVIDFGIARALALEEDPAIDQTQLTRAEELIGTPAWMSPEQAAGAAGGEFDARTDVYGLGVLLYELLTDKLPFDSKLPAEELRRQVQEAEPRKPSARVAGSSKARRFPIDLDWMAMRCLEKQPERRYPSVSSLLQDLGRYDKDEPIEEPPELGYRLHKFVRRHRISLSVAAIVAAAIVAGGIAITYGLLTAREEKRLALESRDTATRQAAIAEAVSGFLSEELLTIEEKDGLLVANPRNHDVMLRSVLERAATASKGALMTCQRSRVSCVEPSRPVS